VTRTGRLPSVAPVRGHYAGWNAVASSFAGIGGHRMAGGRRTSSFYQKVKPSCNGLLCRPDTVLTTPSVSSNAAGVR
jgi:hypothetical protein